MSVRLSALVLGVVALGATAALTYAADKQISSAPRATPQVKAVPLTLVVPDVRRQAYVFAKGILVDAGFAWKVAGSVHGYAANLVVSQSPAPGTKLLDTGSPLVTVTLARNAKYAQTGEPMDTSPYAGTPLRLAEAAVAPTTTAATTTAATTTTEPPPPPPPPSP